METSSDFSAWLSKKIYLINIGMYATVGSVMVLPTLIVAWFDIAPLLASFIAFFLVIFLRATYESLVVYEAPIKSLSPYKMAILTLVTSVIMTLVLFFLKPKLGYFSIPVAVIIALMIVGKLKAALWPVTMRSGFFSKLPEKLDLNKFGTYGFYGFLVGIAYPACTKYGVNFYYAFAAAFFIGVIFEESYNAIKLYEQKLTVGLIICIILWAAFCATVSSTIVWMFIQKFCYAGPTATIIGVITVKLAQPLAARIFILGRGKF